MRHIFLFLLLFTTVNGFAQITLKGTVVDSATGQPVPYPDVLVSDHMHGTVAYSNGIFELTLPDSLKNKSLLVTCIGYDTMRISIEHFLKNSNGKIFLSPQPVLLHVVSIRPGNETCTQEWGITKKKLLWQACMLGKTGEEVALFIPDSAGQNGFISKLHFYVTKIGYPSSLFRAKIYSMDSATGGPCDLLINTDLIAHGTKGHEWVEVDVSSFHIPVPKNGFFVSMEWLPHLQSYHLGGKKDTLTSEGQSLGMISSKSTDTWIRTTTTTFDRWLKWDEFIGIHEKNAMISAAIVTECK